MQTICILIGNSDNKLPQEDWANFVLSVKEVLDRYFVKQHFFGGPPNYDLRQNACWIVDIAEQQLDSLQRALLDVRQRYTQDAAAIVLCGRTVLI